MQSTTTFSRGDVIFVPFLFTDKPASKNRPAIVISSDAYHQSRREVVIAGVTSNTSRRGFVGQVAIRDWQECGLARPSVISGIYMTLRFNLLGVRVGSLGSVDLAMLETSLREALAL